MVGLRIGRAVSQVVDGDGNGDMNAEALNWQSPL